MKIAYFSCSTIYGGVEKIIVDSVNELCHSDEILLIVPKGCEYKDKISNRVRVYEYKSYDKRYNVFLYMEVLRVLREFGADILHTHAAKATQIGFVLSKIADFKLISTKHNNRKAKIFSRVKNVLSVSKEVAKTINHTSKVLYFGIKPVKISPNLPEIFTITAVGRLDKIKGFDILIDEISKLNFPFRLQIIGNGKERVSLENQIKKLNLENRVFLLGFKDNIPEILANSHLQVMSSHKEGLPVTLIEGIFYSQVIISTPVGGIVEILDDEFLAVHENLALKIDEIYKDYDKFRAKFEKKHTKFRKILTLENYISNLRKLYKDIR